MSGTGFALFHASKPEQGFGGSEDQGKSPQGQGYRRGGADGYPLAGSVRGAGLLVCARPASLRRATECDNTPAADTAAQAGPDAGQREAPTMTPIEIALSPVENIAHAIQLSVAPVFLLSGIGVFLGVHTQRLARVIDRARALEQRQEHASTETERTSLDHELRMLARRGRYINRAVTSSVLSAIAVALVVALIFLSEFLHFPLAAPVSLLFIGAMLALLFGLVNFLVEVRVATQQLRIGKH